MARKTRAGLRYFPIDVDMFEDPKVALISAEFGAKGEAILIRLLCAIYRNGYYLEYNKDESLLIGKRVGLEGALIDEVVNGLVRRSFFDKRVFDLFGVLTSNGIQERFIEGTGRRQKVELYSEYLLCKHDVYIENKNVNIVALNVDTGTQTKLNKTKQDETKVEDVVPPLVFAELEKYKTECLKDEIHFIAPLCQQFGHLGLTPKNISMYLSTFNSHLGTTADTDKTKKDYRSHFKNWLPKVLAAKTHVTPDYGTTPTRTI